MKKLILFILVLTIVFSGFNMSYADDKPIRITVLPFRNMDGDMDLNIWCYKLQDSVTKALKAKDPEEKYYVIVPSDSVEILLAELNLDPTNPQYETDRWKVVESLKITKVVTGNFNLEAKRMLINAFIYDVRTKLPNARYQARDIFKKIPKTLEAVPRIIRKLLPGLIPADDK